MRQCCPAYGEGVIYKWKGWDFIERRLRCRNVFVKVLEGKFEWLKNEHIFPSDMSEFQARYLESSQNRSLAKMFAM